MRKIIYIGQGNQQSVYYNTRTREALATESSTSSDTEGAISSKKSKWPWVVFFAFLLVAIISIWIRSLIAPFKLSEWMIRSGFWMFFLYFVWCSRLAQESIAIVRSWISIK